MDVRKEGEGKCDRRNHKTPQMTCPISSRESSLARRVVSLSEKSVTLSHYVEHPPKLAPFLQSLNNNNVHVSSPKNLNEVH